MGIIDDGLNRAVQQAFTRPIPKSAGAQMRYLVRQLKGTRAVAGALGISQRTVERYVRDQIRRPRADLALRLEAAVRDRWQPRVREQARRQAATSTGIVVQTRARFGFTAAPGTTDDARLRHLTVALPRPTPPGSSTPRRRAPTSSSCATSSPEAWARCTSATAATAPTTSKSSSQTSSTSISTSEALRLGSSVRAGQIRQRCPSGLRRAPSVRRMRPSGSQGPDGRFDGVLTDVRITPPEWSSTSHRSEPWHLATIPGTGEHLR